MSGVRLQTENLAVGYNGKALIQEIALSLRPGEIMTLIGPNGAGKSTILRSIIHQLSLIREKSWSANADAWTSSRHRSTFSRSSRVRTPSRPV